MKEKSMESKNDFAAFMVASLSACRKWLTPDRSLLKGWGQCSVAGLLLGMSFMVVAGPLDEALAIAFDESAVIREAEAEMQETARQSNWRGRVYVGYALAETYDAAQGANAGIHVEIPLFSRKRELEAAKSRLRLARARDRLQADFLAAVAKLREQEEKRVEAKELAAFYRDRLAYFDQAVKEGRVESDSLWEDAAKAKKAEHDAARGEVKVKAMLEETARRYGGTRWKQLQALLAVHMKQGRSSMP